MKLYFSPGACSLSPHIALVDIAQWPSLVSFRERVVSRPGVQAALAAEAV